jgi:hypothetical protein
MIWNGIDTKTVGGLFDAVCSVTTTEEAGEFMTALRAENPHADANVGYIIGYGDADTRKRLYDLFQLTHPILGEAAR